MKTTRNIVIDVEINEKLKAIPSASSLINGLLIKHFGSTETPEDKLKRLEAIKQSVDSEYNSLADVEKAKTEQEKAQKEAQKQEDELRAKYYEYMNEHRAEYNEGYKLGKWKDWKEFYELSHK